MWSPAHARGTGWNHHPFQVISPNSWPHLSPSTPCPLSSPLVNQLAFPRFHSSLQPEPWFPALLKRKWLKRVAILPDSPSPFPIDSSTHLTELLFPRRRLNYSCQACWWPPCCPGIPGGSDTKESACNAGDLGSIPGSGRSPGERNGNPLQYSCLENSMDSGAWQAIVHGVTKSQTRLSN